MWMAGILVAQQRCWHLVGTVECVCTGGLHVWAYNQFDIVTVQENQHLSGILVLLPAL